MRSRLKYAYIGMGFGVITGLFAWMIAGGGAPIDWKNVLGVVAFFVMIEGLIGLLFPRRAVNFCGNLLKGMLGHEDP